MSRSAPTVSGSSTCERDRQIGARVDDERRTDAEVALARLAQRLRHARHDRPDRHALDDVDANPRATSSERSSTPNSSGVRATSVMMRQCARSSASRTDRSSSRCCRRRKRGSPLLREHERACSNRRRVSEPTSTRSAPRESIPRTTSGHRFDARATGAPGRARRTPRSSVASSRPVRAAARANRRNDGVEHVETRRTGAKPGRALFTRRRAHVDPDADRDPLRRLIPPARLDQNARRASASPTYRSFGHLSRTALVGERDRAPARARGRRAATARRARRRRADAR